jgi:hypothetical protein
LAAWLVYVRELSDLNNSLGALNLKSREEVFFEGEEKSVVFFAQGFLTFFNIFSRGKIV